MISLDEFIKKYTGKPVDVDKIYPNQCFDLFHQYHVDVLGITDLTTLAFPSAYQIYTDFNKPNLFEKITNTPKNVPNKGDIVVWGKTAGVWGHVAIFVEGDVSKFKSFDANWPTGSLPHIQTHNYTGVLGWLTPKVAPLQSDTSSDNELMTKLEEMRKSRDEWKKEAKAKNAELRDAKKTVFELEEKVLLLQQHIASNVTPLNAKNSSNQWVYSFKDIVSALLSRKK